MLWLAAGTSGFLIALNWAPAVFVAGDVLPTGHDSFYHARRILDATAAPAGTFAGLRQFDPNMHAPEGSWVTWPWAYDYFVAVAVRTLAAILPYPPSTIVVYIPSAWLAVNVAMVGFVCRLLGFGFGLTCAAFLAFAFSPLTQALHGLGRIDHHYIEHFFVLGALALGLWWFREPARPGRAAAYGALLGVASAFYNGLFILTLPALASLLVLWSRRGTLESVAVAGWTGGLLFGVAVAVIPSEPLRQGLFAYYLLSWFHVYVIGSAGLVALVAYKMPFRLRSALCIGLLSLALLVPLLGNLIDGWQLVAGDIPGLAAMTDTYGVLARALEAPLALTREYTALVWLLPFVLGWQVVQLLREERAEFIYFHIACLAGALLLLQQQRFHQYGSFALYLPLGVVWLRWFGNRTGPSVVLLCAISLALWPSLTALKGYPVPGFSASYYLTRGGYRAMAAACADAPGVVLSAPSEGHYIRYHTDCPVIANNFLTTAQHLRKIAFTHSLLELTSIAALRERAPWVSYLWLIREDNVLQPDTARSEVLRANRGLREVLLLGSAPAPGLELLWEARLPKALSRNATTPILARLFKVVGE